ncbi:extracellular triacylglycerol lipase precursor [Mycena leptocephala]|nr:extracellular triacylglycerol lipase precursor [Mycena leptocephala]
MLLLSLFAFLVQLAAASPTIRLGKTTLVGLDLPTFQQDLFAGIPFAEPPLGNLRLRPPVLKASLAAGTFNASAFGPACLQIATIATPGSMSEDCLTINVLRPTGTPTNAKLPVASFDLTWRNRLFTDVHKMFWTYGGGFEIGFAEITNGSSLVAQSVARGTPVIYVNFNYRLGPLGFPQGREARNQGALNLGLKDQLAALKWVTVFGESAGSIMTSILFLNSPITSLARAAIFESGSQASLPLFTPERRETEWETFVAGVPSLLFKRGQFARLPFIAGTNLDEGTLFTDPTVNSSVGISESLVAQYSPSASPRALDKSILTLLKLYPDIPSLGSPFNTGNETFGLSSQYKRAAAIAGDSWFHSQRRLWMETAAHAGIPTFAYLFTQPLVDGLPQLGVLHGSEVPYVYGVPVDASPSSLLMSQLLPNYWISFATSLTPNDGLGLLRKIPREHRTNIDNGSTQVVIQLNGANTTVIPDDFRKEQMDFINSDPTIWHH